MGEEFIEEPKMIDLTRAILNKLHNIFDTFQNIFRCNLRAIHQQIRRCYGSRLEVLVMLFRNYFRALGILLLASAGGAISSAFDPFWLFRTFFVGIAEALRGIFVGVCFSTLKTKLIFQSCVNALNYESRDKKVSSMP